jgi:preprotein translocase subunit SecG
MLFFVLIGLHVIVSVFLIAVILLQAGRGGGLSDVFGGGAASTIFGTKANVFLTRITVVAAVIFILTSLTLAVMSAHRARSLMERGVPVQSMPMQTAPTPAEPEQ